MLTARETLSAMVKQESNFWLIPLMNFVDDYRRTKNNKLFEDPLDRTGTRFDQLITSVVEYLCDETESDHPDWVDDIEGLKRPWFVSGLEDLKAFAIVESHLHFRKRNIFVHDNFLFRV